MAEDLDVDNNVESKVRNIVIESLLYASGISMETPI